MPAMIGETTCDPIVVEKIQKLIWANAEPVRTIQAPVYDFQAS